MSINCFTLLPSVLQAEADIVIVLVRLGRSMRLNRGERRKSTRRVCVCWGGAAPPIIKLTCCVEGPCLQGRRGSFLHSVDSSERGEGSSELSHSLLTLVISATHPSLRCDWRPAHTGWLTTSWGGGASSDSSSGSICLTHHHHQHQHHPSSLPGPGHRLCCRRLHHRRHHVRLFPPGLPQLARRLLRDGWASLCFLFPPSAVSLIQQQGSVMQWERLCFVRVFVMERVSVRRLVLMLSCVADLQWVLGVSAECRGVFEDVIIAGCQAALRFFLFPSGCVFDAEAERQTD